MGTILTRPRKNGMSYQVRIRRVNARPFGKTFRDLGKAEQWLADNDLPDGRKMQQIRRLLSALNHTINEITERKE